MNPLHRLRLILRHGKHGGSRFISGDAHLCSRTRLTTPCYIAAHCRIKRCSIGSHSYVSRASRIHDTTIGNFCSIGPECLIGGLGIHPKDLFSTSPTTYSPDNPVSRLLGHTSHAVPIEESGRVVIGHDVWIGARCIINDRVSIGTGAIIGANTVVTKDVPPYAIVYGSPTKIQGYRFTPERIDALLASGWWNLTLDEIDRLGLLQEINQDHRAAAPKA